MISASVAPALSAAAVWPRMQYGHWVAWATATAISSLVFLGRAPSAKTLSVNALKAASGSGASALRLRAVSTSQGGYMGLSGIGILHRLGTRFVGRHPVRTAVLHRSPGNAGRTVQPHRPGPAPASPQDRGRPRWRPSPSAWHHPCRTPRGSVS